MARALDDIKAAFRDLDGDDQVRFRRWITTGNELTRDEQVADALIQRAKLVASGTPAMDAERQTIAGLDFNVRELYFDFKKDQTNHSRIRTAINKRLENGNWTTVLSSFSTSLNSCQRKPEKD